MSGGSALDTGGGGASNESASASDSGDIRGGEKAYGGINIAPASGFALSGTTLAFIAVAIVAVIYARKKKLF